MVGKKEREERRRARWPNNREVLTAVLRFARYSERGMVGAERQLCHLCGIPKPPEWNWRQRIPRMPRIFNVKMIRTQAERG